MASYAVNHDAVAHCRELIEKKQYVLDSDWGSVQPGADAQNAFLERHSWEEYAAWHLGLTEGATDETKARYAFVYGDLRRVHRTASSRASTARRSGGTRTSSSPRTTCCSCSTALGLTRLSARAACTPRPAPARSALYDELWSASFEPTAAKVRVTVTSNPFRPGCA